VLVIASLTAADPALRGAWHPRDPGAGVLHAAVQDAQAAPNEAPAPAGLTARDSARILQDAQRAVRIGTSYMYRSPLEQVIARLDEYGERLPGSNWIAGHRVGLRIKAKDLDGALQVARSCQAD